MPDLFRQEARRLAKLPARDRKEALAVHRRIADDTRLSTPRATMPGLWPKPWKS